MVPLTSRKLINGHETLAVVKLTFRNGSIELMWYTRNTARPALGQRKVAKGRSRNNAGSTRKRKPRDESGSISRREEQSQRFLDILP